MGYFLMKETKERKLMKWFKKTTILSIFILVFLNIDFIIFIAHRIIEVLGNPKLFNNDLSDIIRNFYNFTQLSAIRILIFSLVILVLLYITIKFKDHRRNLDFGNNIFEKSLYDYLEKEEQKKGYLITGEWGSGKTYILNAFINEFYKYSSRPIYNISCYGLNNRELVIKEINNQLEINDESLLSWLKYIPLIGDPLYSFLKDSSTLPNIKKNSIFIFDDFERITPMRSISEFNLKTHQYSRPRSFESRTRFLAGGTQTFQEFEDINNEFKKIADNINFNSKMDNQILKQKYLSQYNAITGLINELIEYYGFKVIIICNTDILGSNYMDEIFRGKLDCITYSQSPDLNTIENMFTQAVKNQIFNNKKTEEIVKNNIHYIYEDFFEVWKKSNHNNLRLVNSLINSYLSTLNKLFSDKQPTEPFLYSLFYSMFIVILLRDNKNLEVLSNFLTGGNLGFYLNLYEPDSFINILRYSKHYENLQWTGISISGAQILNMAYPKNISDLMTKYNFYPYTQLEKQLNNLQNKESKNFKFDSYDLINDNNLLEVHYSYLIKLRNLSSTENKKMNTLLSTINDAFLESFSNKINNLPVRKSSMTDNIINILTSIYNILNSTNSYNYNNLNELFEVIYTITEIEKLESTVEDNYNVINAYNNYVFNIKQQIDSQL